MKISPAAYEEYLRRHDNLWPELKEVLKLHGIHRYSIFINKLSGELFSYFEIEDEILYKRLESNEIMRKWWKYMDSLMDTHSNHQPVETPLKCVFYLE